jgi:predicted glycosyltransferase
MSSDYGNPFSTSHYVQAQRDGFDFPLRVLLYSHDSVGLGHLRRNLAIAGEIAATFPNSSMLVVTGSPCATQFQLPDNTDLVKIPSISKDEQGRYVSRNFSGPLVNALNFRSDMILEAFRSFKPTLVIMDHQLIGLKGEALRMLHEAKDKGVLTIYGSRDIKDSPDVVKNNWDNDDCRWALSEGYDRVCVYGMSEVFDPRIAYAPLLDKTRQVDFTGYLVRPYKKSVEKLKPGRRKKVLVTFGGGSDGADRAQSYLRALALAPVTWDSHIITGPLMNSDRKRLIRQQAKKTQPIGSIKIQKFHRNIPALLRQVDAVVGMAGYNSCAEILQSGVPAVLLPRSFPRQEQLIRANLMAKLGWVTVLPEADPEPQTLLNAVTTALASPRREHASADLNGLGRLCGVIHELLLSAGLIQTMSHLEHPKNSAM